MLALLTPFPAHSTGPQLWAYLSEANIDSPAGVACLQWLQAHRPAVANEVLCLAYGIWCYQLNDAYPPDTAARADTGKWFVSVDVGSQFDDARLSQIPLADNYEEACRLAVNVFNLAKLFSDQGESIGCATV
jgi:hypothetical protein